MPTTHAIEAANRLAQRLFQRYLDGALAGHPDLAQWARYVEAEDAYYALRGLERNEDAAHDAADWRLSVAVAEYTTLPDVPLADKGDHYAGMRS